MGKGSGRKRRSFFVDLYAITADKYDALGHYEVKPFFQVDHAHTNIDGAKLNAEIIVKAIKQIKPGTLANYLSDKK